MPTKEWREKNADKMKAYRRKWYAENKTAEREKAKVRQSGRRKTLKKWFREYKSTLSCNRCGFKHPAALDFHHKDPSTKKFTIGAELSSFSKEILLEEISKCEVICANCHRIHHYEENV